MSLPTPYDGSSRLFQIGLKPLDPAEWIDVDDTLAAQLAEKRRAGFDIFGRRFCSTLARTADTASGCRERTPRRLTPLSK